mgnify:CR=1 FL=1
MKKCHVCGKRIWFWQSKIATYPKTEGLEDTLRRIKEGKLKPEKYAHAKCEPEVDKVFQELEKKIKNYKLKEEVKSRR